MNPDPNDRPPIRGPRYDTPRGGKLLTDRDIDRYILAGFYGETRRRALLDRQKAEKARRTARKPTLRDALDLINKHV